MLVIGGIVKYESERADKIKGKGGEGQTTPAKFEEPAVVVAENKVIDEPNNGGGAIINIIPPGKGVVEALPAGAGELPPGEILKPPAGGLGQLPPDELLKPPVGGFEKPPADEILKPPAGELEQLPADELLEPPAGGFEEPANQVGDVRASEVGFVRQGSNVYADRVNVNEKGAIVISLSNRSDKKLEWVKCKVEVDGRMIARKAETLEARVNASFLFENYAFNTVGRHVMRLTVDPDNEIEESDEADNVVESTIEVVAPAADEEPAQQLLVLNTIAPKTPIFDMGVSAGRKVNTIKPINFSSGTSTASASGVTSKVKTYTPSVVKLDN